MFLEIIHNEINIIKNTFLSTLMTSTTQLFPKYTAIRTNNQSASYLLSQYMPVSYNSDDNLNTLWNIHDTTLNQQIPTQNKPKTSLLDLKITIAEKLYHHCNFCEHHCGINRNKTIGHCKVSNTKIASAFLHQGEESFLIPSYTIFFSGCNFTCLFCQNHDISQTQTGYSFSPTQLATIIQQTKKDATNINFVGGEPTPHLLFILKTLKQLAINKPLIWNSNMYCSIETMKLLNGIIDLYLTDFKFGNSHCAQELAQIKQYPTIIKRNHLLAAKQTELLIRHLILPNHVDCCTKPILEFINNHHLKSPIHLMTQYHPAYQTKNHQSLNRSLNIKEKNNAIHYAKQLDINLL